MQRILPPFPALMWLSALVLVLLFSQCKSPSSPDQASTTIIADSNQDHQPDSAASDRAFPDSMFSEAGNRSLGGEVARIGDFSFKDYFPVLYALLEGDEPTFSSANAYAEQVITRSGINSESDLETLFTQRAEEIMPFVQTRIETLDDEQFYNQWKPLEAELNQLGFTLRTAEGMFTGLAIYPVLEGEMLRLGSPAFQKYMEFSYAAAVAGNGEYPFANQEAYLNMIVAGEALRKLEEEEYYPQIEEMLEMALHTFTDVHLVSSRSARESAPSPMAMGVSTEFYPYLTETETLASFAEGNSEDPVGQVAARLMENMSEMTDQPENLYLIVTEWQEEQEQANARVLTHLRAGEDIPHVLRIRQGDGKDRYAVTYRFYEDADKADAALRKILPDFPEAEMVFVSVKGEELYQLGPAN